MSEKLQHTAARLQERMNNRYNDGLHHKHNKNHLSFRKHFRSHPCQLVNNKNDEDLVNGSTGSLREFNLRKLRKRLDKGRIH
ncbi:hypothetical protein [Legionella waltersii]|uniref:Uncharacterized protein n=1 Tax=Legionella waltersii TaxID=66969 RepID=A0A0W1A555_9GAMM|nr:hypothetical protein [Legionella waltersii]KTD76475.1 hypothetical protein Lwal_2197 [Legionella waltersii]SNV14669.1 Uncharacterised protein [Legionella waltersii]